MLFEWLLDLAKQSQPLDERWVIFVSSTNPRARCGSQRVIVDRAAQRF
jgi:hypothetical protein